MRLPAALFLAAIIAVACGGAAGAPGRPADIEGVLTSVTSSAGRIQSVLVEERPDERSGSDKASLSIQPTTRISLVQADGRIVAAAPADLRQGQRIRAWFSGPVRESYPVQADAEAILILRSP